MRKKDEYPRRLREAINRDDEGRLWFTEISEFWRGLSLRLEINRVIHYEVSEFQEISVLDSFRFQRVLVLDGAIQITTLDECAYQETLAHIPMHLIKPGRVKRALVIGGGDGGVLRELAKYPEIEEIHLCEIDAAVIRICQQYIPETAVGFSDKRVRVHIEDGIRFLERAVYNHDVFDVVISDLSDPVGPAGSLYNSSFLNLLSQVLDPDIGVASLQAECYWLHSDFIRALVIEARKHFSDAQYASVSVPSYPCGQIGCLVMCRNQLIKVNQPIRGTSISEESQYRYYSKSVHAASFVLPKLVQQLVYGSDE
jgi:spermidine synthase